MRTRAGSAPDEVQTGAAPRRRSRAEAREALQLAIPRVKSKGLKRSISAVATEAVDESIPCVQVWFVTRASSRQIVSL